MELNKKKITFVMGAGASQPFIKNGNTCLSTKYLTEQIYNRDRWDAICNEFRQNYPADKHPELNFQVTVDEILAVINKIKKMNENDAYGIGETTFEHILYLLDKVCNYRDDKKHSIDNILFDIRNDDDIQRNQRGWNYVPFLCREVIINAIIELWESCDKTKAIEINKQFFTSVLEQFEIVSIYSLNYDPLLYEAIKQIKVKGSKKGHVHDDKGFETGFINKEYFNSKYFYLNDNVVAFLHGHIGFVPYGGKDGLYFEENYLNAQKQRISNVAWDYGGHCRKGPKGIHYNVSIISGLEKFEGFYDNPYAYYIQRFSEDIMDEANEYIVFIGSGLGDAHINLFATNAYRLVHGYDNDPQNMFHLRKSDVGRKKIIVVTSGWKRFKELKGTNRKCIEFLFEKQSDDSLKLFDLLKVGIDVYDTNSVEECLKNNGYARINPDLFLYLKGTENFLSEMLEIKNDLFD
jgi:hypothetical protein